MRNETIDVMALADEFAAFAMAANSAGNSRACKNTDATRVAVHAEQLPILNRFGRLSEVTRGARITEQDPTNPKYPVESLTPLFVLNHHHKEWDRYDQAGGGDRSELEDFEDALEHLAEQNAGQALAVITALAKSEDSRDRELAGMIVGTLAPYYTHETHVLWRALIMDEEVGVYDEADRALETAIREQRLSPDFVADITSRVIDELRHQRPSRPPDR